jgi:multidrug resistance protein, MATE family
VTSAKVDHAPLVEGSLWKAIWLMSWPLTLQTVAVSIVGMVDVQVAGLISHTAQAAVGLAEQVMFLFMIFLMSLGVGTTAIVSRAYGAKDLQGTTYATGQSLALSMVSGGLLMVLSFLTADYLLPLFSKSPDVVAMAHKYLITFALYLVPFSFIHIANAAFRAIGNAKVPLLVVGVEVVVNIIGDYLTVVYQWPVKGLGIQGIAWSAVAGAVVGTCISIYWLLRSPLRDAFKHLLPVSRDAIGRVLNVGLPAGAQRLSWAASVFGVFFILSQLPHPTAALASWTIGMRVEGLLFMPLMALSMAVGAIVGQNLGAQQYHRAHVAGWHVTWIGVGLMVVLSVPLFIFAEPCARLMSPHDADTIKITADYLRINAIAEPFLAVNMILSGALQGAGDTRITMWISIFHNWIVRLPLAWFLAFNAHWAANGVWAAMAISVALSSLIVAWRFQSGVWAKTRV